MYIDPFEPLRESQSNLRDAVRNANVIQSIDMPKMINAQQIAAQLQPDWSAIYKASTIDKAALSKAFSMQRQMAEFSETIIKLSQPSFQLNQIDIEELFDSAKYMRSISEIIKPIRLNISL